MVKAEKLLNSTENLEESQAAAAWKIKTEKI
jgi:hypothetical protein